MERGEEAAAKTKTRTHRVVNIILAPDIFLAIPAEYCAASDSFWGCVNYLKQLPQSHRVSLSQPQQSHDYRTEGLAGII